MRVNWNETEDIGITTCFNGIPFSGICFRLHENGKVLEECEVVNGLKEGIYKVFSKDGVLIKEGYHVNDKANGIFTFYNDEGVMEMKLTYKNDIEIDRNINSDLPTGYFLKKMFVERDESFFLSGMASLIFPDSDKETSNEVPDLKEFSSEKNTSRLKKIEVKYKFEKYDYEFENIKEIFDFLESNDDIKIRIEASTEYDGFCQLINDKRIDNIKHHNLYHDGEEVITFSKKEDEIVMLPFYKKYDMQKQTYKCNICEWQLGFTNKEVLINLLNKFVNEDDENAFETIHEFYNFLEIDLGHCYEAAELFSLEYQQRGEGRFFGIDEYSWSLGNFKRYTEVSLIFCK